MHACKPCGNTCKGRGRQALHMHVFGFTPHPAFPDHPKCRRARHLQALAKEDVKGVERQRRPGESAVDEHGAAGAHARCDQLRAGAAHRVQRRVRAAAACMGQSGFRTVNASVGFRVPRSTPPMRRGRLHGLLCGSIQLVAMTCLSPQAQPREQSAIHKEGGRSGVCGWVRSQTC